VRELSEARRERGRCFRCKEGVTVPWTTSSVCVCLVGASLNFTLLRLFTFYFCRLLC
jgi:hypothetical protein